MAVTYLALRTGAADGLAPGLMARIARVVPFTPDDSTTFDAATVALYVWTKDATLWPRPTYVEVGDAACVVSGCGVDDDGEPIGAARLLRDIESAWERFHGEWSGCRVDPAGIVALSSSAGTEHVYYLELPGVTAVSNRARTLWELSRACGVPLEADLENLASLVSMGYIACTDRTAVRGIRHLSADSLLRIPAATGAAGVTALDRSFFLPRGSSPDYSSLAGGLRTNVRWLGASSVPKLVALTGGKDSRLVLAALRSEHVADGCHFFLTAPRDHNDSLVASDIATRLGLTLERRDPGIAPNFLDELSRHVAFTEGTLNAWDFKGGSGYIRQIGVFGLFGELYRGRRGRQPKDERDAATCLAPDIDVGIVRPHIRERERRDIAVWTRELRAAGVGLDVLRDAFYLRQRVPRWAGAARLRDGLTGIQLNPLYHLGLVRAYRQLSEPDRLGERLHFELMQRLCPELVPMPFAGDRWDPAMVARCAEGIPVATEPVEHRAPMLGSGWQIPTLKVSWEALRQDIADGADALDAIVSRRRLTALLDIAEVVLGLRASRLARWHATATSPLMLRSARRRPAALAQQLFGLLTILALLREIHPKHELEAVRVAPVDPT